MKLLNLMYYSIFSAVIFSYSTVAAGYLGEVVGDVNNDDKVGLEETIYSLRATAGIESPTYQTNYSRTIIISPTGDQNIDGNKLLEAIDNISDASNSNPYLIKLEPGAYYLYGTTGKESLYLKEYVDIEGSGPKITKIVSGHFGSGDRGTIMGASNCEVRGVTIENIGNAAYSKAVYCDEGESPVFRNVIIRAIGGTSHNYSVHCLDSSSPSFMYSEIVSEGTIGDNKAFNVGGTGITKIVGCKIKGMTNSVHNHDRTTLLSTSQIEGPILNENGIVRCIYCYDNNFSNFNGYNICP